jgi:hypothetical protein
LVLREINRRKLLSGNDCLRAIRKDEKNMYVLDSVDAGRPLAAVCLLLLTSVFTCSCTSVGVAREGDWDKGLGISRNQVTDTLTVADPGSAVTLFSFYDEPSAQPILVRKIDANHWVAVYEKPNVGKRPSIEIQTSNPDEFHLIYTRPAK